MTDVLRVLLCGSPIGVLSRSTRGELAFTYDRDYANGPGPVLSPDLPWAIGVSRVACWPNLEGLLPEDRAVRQQWSARFGVVDEAFDLLSHMGLDCPGAVQFVPDDATGPRAAGERLVPNAAGSSRGGGATVESSSGSASAGQGPLGRRALPCEDEDGLADLVADRRGDHGPVGAQLRGVVGHS